MRHKVNICKQYQKEDNAPKVVDAGTETSGAVGIGYEKKLLNVVFASLLWHTTPSIAASGCTKAEPILTPIYACTL